MRQVTPKYAHHAFCGRENNREIVLIGKGKGAYLLVGPVAGDEFDRHGRVKNVYVFSGTKTLRAFANAILAATEAGR